MCKQVHQLIECMRLRSHVYHITYFTTMASDVDIFMHSYDMHSSSRDRHETTNAARCLLAIAVQVLTMPSHSARHTLRPLIMAHNANYERTVMDHLI